MTFQGSHPAKDVDHMELRRQERAQRLHRPHGREMSPRTRSIALAAIIVIAIALVLAMGYAWVRILAG